MSEELPLGAQRVLNVLERDPEPQALRVQDLRYALHAVDEEVKRHQALFKSEPSQHRLEIAEDLVRLLDYRDKIRAKIGALH